MRKSIICWKIPVSFGYSDTITKNLINEYSNELII